MKTLADDLHSTTEKAQEIMDAVLNAYPVMAKWMQDATTKATKQGYIDNIFGRRRRWPALLKPQYEFIFPDGTDEKTKEYYSAIYSSKLKKAWFKDKENIKAQIRAKGVKVIDWESEKAKANRQIHNFCIQSGAAVVTMRAMRNVSNNARLKELGCKLVMSVHDELLCTVPRHNIKEAVKLIEHCMLSAGDGLAVPLACDTEVSDRWYGEPMEV